MKASTKDILIPTLSLFLICLVVTALLAVTNHKTAPLIAEISAQNEAEQRKVVLPAAETFEQVTGHDNAFAGYTPDGTLCGFVFTEKEKGYGGEITVMVGIDTAANVTGVSILEHGETPGLGANVTKDKFLEQYKQNMTGELSVTKDGGTIDAVTGATISSRAVTRAVNAAYADYKAIISEGGMAA
ncbi:MAG: RnfABCDGE type electron transport complex subunit G [Clostridia bacterium]|nr:RnfABCDGE type electron transport complex subunit G [Clostridia bacterium]